MARKGSKGGDGKGRQLDVYRRIRKPMPPPERVIPDRRQTKRDELAAREADDDLTERGRRTRGDEPNVP